MLSCQLLRHTDGSAVFIAAADFRIAAEIQLWLTWVSVATATLLVTVDIHFMLPRSLIKGDCLCRGLRGYTARVDVLITSLQSIRHIPRMPMPLLPCLLTDARGLRFNNGRGYHAAGQPASAARDRDYAIQDRNELMV